jgi:hypothetical protein
MPKVSVTIAVGSPFPLQRNPQIVQNIRRANATRVARQSTEVQNLAIECDVLLYTSQTDLVQTYDRATTVVQITARFAPDQKDEAMLFLRKVNELEFVTSVEMEE